MSATQFIQGLFETGRVRVDPAAQAPDDLGDAVEMLDRSARPQLAFAAPALLPAVGQWALLAMYRACQALVYREIPAEAIADALTQPCPAKPSPAACYSADLAFCLMPDLVRLARGVAADDPLVSGLMALSRQWPLSSVGMKNVGEIEIGDFICDRSLRQLYVDRIIERTDVSRLSDPAVREALGAHRQLSPPMAAALEQST